MQVTAPPEDLKGPRAERIKALWEVIARRMGARPYDVSLRPHSPSRNNDPSEYAALGLPNNLFFAGPEAIDLLRLAQLGNIWQRMQGRRSPINVQLEQALRTDPMMGQPGYSSDDAMARFREHLDAPRGGELVQAEFVSRLLEAIMQDRKTW